MDDYVEYKKAYEALQTTFNPVKFDPERWAKAAKDAGMKYVVFTTKHHDGFSMFDTKQTDYRITSPKTPFSSNPRADVTRGIFDAFRAQGFMVGAYFSKPDWHSPDYWWPYFATPDRNPNYDIKKYPDRWTRFVDFTHAQIDELMSRYGRSTSSGSTAAGCGTRTRRGDQGGDEPPGLQVHARAEPGHRHAAPRRGGAREAAGAHRRRSRRAGPVPELPDARSARARQGAAVSVGSADADGAQLVVRAERRRTSRRAC